MRIKYFAFMTLMLCVGVFLFPMTAYARNITPPTVDGFIRGDTLLIEAQNGDYAVEAIYANGIRFNFRVDSALIVDLLAFENSEIITVYAIDFAGNRSNVMMFINPYYTGIGKVPEPIPEPPPENIPVTVQTNPLTPDGQATVLDNVTDCDEKEFFTFSTPAGNVFFLIVDRQRETDNVYFLNAVTERDLMDLAEQSGTPLDNNIGGIPISPYPILPNEPVICDEEDYETETDLSTAASGGGNNGTLIFLLLGIAAVGGAGYYMKIVRPKQQAVQEGDDYEDEDNEDLGDEMEFENDAGEDDEHNEPPHDDYYDLSDDSDKEQAEREDEDE